MYATIHPFSDRCPDRRRGAAADPLGTVVLGAPDGAGGTVLALWPDADSAARAGAGRVYRVSDDMRGPSAGRRPMFAQVTWLNGDGDRVRADAAEHGGRHRIWPAVRDIDGIVEVFALRSDDDRIVVVGLATEPRDPRGRAADHRRDAAAAGRGPGPAARPRPGRHGPRAVGRPADGGPVVTAQLGAVRVVAGTWSVSDTRTSVGFAVGALGRTAHGTVPCSWGEVVVDASGAPVRVRAGLDLEGLDTGIAKRDADLRKPRFLDIDRHPTMTWSADRFRPTGDGGWTAEGTLSVRGTSAALTVTGRVEDADPDGAWVRVHATGVLDRTAVGIRAPADHRSAAGWR